LPLILVLAMYASFEVASSSGAYGVEIEAGAFKKTLTASKDAVAMCDERFVSSIQKAGLKTIAIPAEEAAKSLDAIPTYIINLRKLGANRRTPLLAVGGGIVQDVAAFCAAIYMRGLSWTYIPTTLLGMADSCIGGKSSINVGEYKNIVGTFLPPQKILIDPDLAATLSPEQIIAGLCEAAKICFCRGPKEFQAYMKIAPTLTMDERAITEIITTSLLAKKWFIETDEYDRKERLLLNFGHTFGHALEGATHFRVSHGIAVGLGMLCALAFGRRLGRSYEGALLQSVRDMESHIDKLLQQHPTLPKQLAGVEVSEVLDRFAADKKHTSDHFSIVMVNASGAAVLENLSKTDATRAPLGDAIADVLKCYA